MLAFEIALPVGAVAFYLYDCALLLFANDLVYIWDSKRWKANGGLEVFVWGKRLCLPSVLDPRALVFRVTWSERDVRTGAPHEWPQAALLAALKPLRIVCSALHVMLLALLPLFCIGFGTGLMLLALFGAFYLTILLALVLVYRRREALGLRGKAFWLLALDVLACPPFAVNIVRKVTLPLRLDGNPLVFAANSFTAAERQRLLALIRRRVDERLATEDPEDERTIKLAAFRDQLIRDAGA